MFFITNRPLTSVVASAPISAPLGRPARIRAPSRGSPDASTTLPVRLISRGNRITKSGANRAPSVAQVGARTSAYPSARAKIFGNPLAPVLGVFRPERVNLPLASVRWTPLLQNARALTSAFSIGRPSIASTTDRKSVV